MMDAATRPHYSRSRRLSNEPQRPQQNQQRKRRIFRRIENHPAPPREHPIIAASNFHGRLANRVQELRPGVATFAGDMARERMRPRRVRRENGYDLSREPLDERADRGLDAIE
jgi:hypothetical protein